MAIFQKVLKFALLLTDWWVGTILQTYNLTECYEGMVGMVIAMNV